MEITTTLNAIRQFNPCSGSWKKALHFLGKTGPDDEPLALLTILESNGLDDALWSLRVLDAKYDNAMRLFACFCAKYSLDIFEKGYPEDKRPRMAIETAERYAMGHATKEEMSSASADAWDAARGAAWSAAWDAVLVATWDAARDASGDAARAASRAAVFAAGINVYLSSALAAVWAEADDTTRDHFTNEFKRMCKLEGDYGVVVTD